MKKIGVYYLWIGLALFCVALAVLMKAVPSGREATSLSWILLEAIVFVIDVVMLIKYRFPGKERIIASILLAVLVLAAYVDMSILKNEPAWFNLFVDPILTLMSSLVCFKMFEKYPQKSGYIFRKHSLDSMLVSIIIGVAVGIAWGTLNIFLMMGSNESNVTFSIHCVMSALSPAVFEEITLRTVFWSLYLALLKGKEPTKLQSITCYVMMILPHVLIHTPSTFIAQGMISGLICVLVYTVLYGFIFAFLQKKRDLSSAMIAHGVLDLMRFCFFGIPI